MYKLLVKKTDCAILPRPVFTVVGLNAFHTIVSQILVAMKREMPEPRPYPFWSSSSKSRTIKPATKSYSKKRNTALVPCHFHFKKKNKGIKARRTNTKKAKNNLLPQWLLREAVKRMRSTFL